MTKAHESNLGAAGHSPGECRAVGAILARIGDKWSVLAVMVLGNGSLRFNELKRAMGSVSQRMLTVTLRGLERDGLVKRTVFPTIPPRVDYELTDLGRSFWTPVQEISDWVLRHQGDIDAARILFDTQDSEVFEPA